MASIASAPAAERRWRFEDSGQETVVTISRKFDWWFAVLFPLLWLPFLFMVVTGPELRPSVALFFIVAFAISLKQWLWEVRGTDVVTINDESVSVRYDFFGFFCTRRTPLANVEGVTWEKRVRGRYGHSPWVALIRKDKTFWFVSEIPFADGVSQAEGNELIDEIQQRLPNIPNLHFKGADWQ